MSQSAAAVIATANSKGGCGKSTTILILAGEYAAQGLRVHIIDADPKRRLVKWAQAGAKPDAISVSDAGAAKIRDEIEKASSVADVVLIDVEGTANAALTLADGALAPWRKGKSPYILQTIDALAKHYGIEGTPAIHRPNPVSVPMTIIEMSCAASQPVRAWPVASTARAALARAGLGRRTMTS